MNCPACHHVNPAEAKFCNSCGSALAEQSAASPVSVAAPSPPLPEAFVDGRYRVDGLLGEGSRKTVYRAHDTRLDRDVAFALLKTTGLDSAEQERVQREAQAMGRSGGHPHIVTIHDFGEEDGQPYIVTEYMRGGDLDQELREADGHRLPIGRALHLADQLCQALEHAHRQGIVHRDVKPENIWLTADGAAQLGDFGLALALDQSPMTHKGTVLGTVAYMAPEQAMGADVDAHADLYSLGCVLYQLVAGRPPFVGDDAVAVISQHLNAEPVALSRYAESCPPDLEALIMRLLAKDPRQRPANAAEVRMTILSILNAAPSPAAPSPAAPAPPPEVRSADVSPVYRRTFVGRDRELGQLRAAFDAALASQGGLVMVVGEPGIGKTTLTEQLATYVASRDGETLVGHCYEEGSLSLPYLAFVEAMRTHTLHQDKDSLLRQLGTGVSDVARIVPEIQDALQVEATGATTPEEDRYRLLQSVATFLCNAAEDRPLCVVLEDLHDADGGTLELLTHLSRHLAGTRLLVVGTYRDMDVDRTHPLSAALAELRRGTPLERISLRGLTSDEVHRMLANIASEEVPWGLAEAVHRQTEGNPLFIQELFRYISDEGLLRREPGTWTATNVDSLIVQIPEGLRDVIGRRLSRLSPQTEQVLSVASVIGRDFRFDLLGLASTVSRDAVLDALEEAQRAAVIEEHSGVGGAQYRFTHAFFRQTLYEESSAARRILIHQQIARALEGLHENQTDEHAAELAEHFAHSSDPEDLSKAVRYAEVAARRATSVYAYGDAVRLLEQAIDVQEVLNPNALEDICDLLTLLSQALLAAGEPQRIHTEVAIRTFELAERLDDSERASRACRIALESLLSTAGVGAYRGEAAATWTERADRYAKPGTVDRVWADVSMGLSLTVQGKAQDGSMFLRRALEAAREMGESDASYAAATAWLWMMQGASHQQYNLQLAQDILTWPREGARVSTLANCLAPVSHTFLCWGDRERAEDIWREIGDLAERTQESTAVSVASTVTAVSAFLSGRLEDAVAAAETPGHGQTEAWALNSFVVIPPLLLLGRTEEALEQVGPYPFLAVGCLLAAGRRQDAAAVLEEFLGVVNVDRLDSGPGELSTWMCALLLESAAELGNRDFVIKLRRLLDEAETKTGGIWRPASIDRQRSIAPAFEGDYDLARTHLIKGLEAAQAIDFRPELALCRYQLAQLQLEHYPAERTEALAHLDFAITEFQEMGMTPVVEQAIRLKLEEYGIADTDVHTSIEAVAEAVGEERPDLTRQTAPDGTVTLLFSDIVGSTALNERMGDAAWMRLLQEHNRLVRTALQAHAGYEVKTMGDGFMLAFGSALDGVRCAIAMQQALAEYNASAAEVITVRIGLHTGEAIKDADDFFGTHVALAARIGSTADASQILVSSLVRDLTDAAGEFRFDRGRAVELKGLAQPQHVFRILWQPDDVVDPYPDGLSAREMEVLRLVAAGKRNSEIADRLIISPATVTRHVSNILNKTGLSNRTELARYASSHRLID